MKLFYSFTILLFVAAGFSQNSLSQDLPKIRKIGDNELIQNVDDYKLISTIRTSVLRIILFEKQNTTGDSLPDTVGTTSIYLIMVSLFDNSFKDTLFELGPLTSPKFVNWSGESEQKRELTIRYGPINKQKYITFLVSPDELKMVE